MLDRDSVRVEWRPWEHLGAWSGNRPRRRRICASTDVPCTIFCSVAEFGLEPAPRPAQCRLRRRLSNSKLCETDYGQHVGCPVDFGPQVSTPLWATDHWCAAEVTTPSAQCQVCARSNPVVLDTANPFEDKATGAKTRILKSKRVYIVDKSFECGDQGTPGFAEQAREGPGGCCKTPKTSSQRPEVGRSASRCPAVSRTMWSPTINVEPFPDRGGRSESLPKTFGHKPCIRRLALFWSMDSRSSAQDISPQREFSPGPFRDFIEPGCSKGWLLQEGQPHRDGEPEGGQKIGDGRQSFSMAQDSSSPCSASVGGGDDGRVGGG